MRYRYLVCYDIADAKRLRRTFKKMHGFGDPLQYSVFRCDLNVAERLLMVGALQEIINTKVDRVMIVRLGSVDEARDDRVEFLGKPLAAWERQRAVIV
ncbi:MAG: CRISPR-associated endonuclease Cas2 [Planctomycetota bacterium]